MPYSICWHEFAATVIVSNTIDLANVSARTMRFGDPVGPGRFALAEGPFCPRTGTAKATNREAVSTVLFIVFLQKVEDLYPLETIFSSWNICSKSQPGTSGRISGTHTVN